MEKSRLTPANAKVLFEQLKDQLGLADQERILRIFSLFWRQNTLALSELLCSFYPDQSEPDAIALFEQFRSRIQQAADEAGIALELVCDPQQNSSSERRSGGCINTLTGHQGSIRACAFSPDGSTLLSASADNTLKLWDRETGQCMRTHVHLPGSGHAVLTENSILSASENAWRYLGWREEDKDILRLWPAEIYGPLPGSGGDKT